MKGKPVSINHIAFLTPGNFSEAAPAQGLEAALRLIEFGEKLGFNGAWIRSRHLERGISSAATFLAAAGQRTSTVELGTAVIQLGYENTFRLAEDLATADLLSGERLQVGLSAGQPLYGSLLGDRLFEGNAAEFDFSHNRALRLRENLSGVFLGSPDQLVSSPAGDQQARIQPHSPTLHRRLWYGGGSLRSLEWAGKNGFNILIGNLNQGETTDSFFEAQQQHLDIFRSNWAHDHEPRIALGRVIVPTDQADVVSKRRYQEFAASRHERTLSPQGPRRTLFAKDLVGPSDFILEALRSDPILPSVQELRLELPYDLELVQYQQILSDFATSIAPELGWQPSPSSVPLASAANF